MTKPLYFWNGTTFELVGPTTPQSPFAYQTSAPTAPATGDIWIDSDGDVDTYNRQLTRFYFVATAGQTSVSGTDANGLTLAYVAGSEQVYVNGALQVRGVDYTATNGTSITGLSALALNDVVEVFAYTAFTVANAYTKAESDSFRTGNTIQVVSATYSTSQNTSSSAESDTGLTASITPSSASNKILVIVNQSGVAKNTGNQGVGLKLYRDSTSISHFATELGYNNNTSFNITSAAITYLDSPNTTSAITYKTRFNASGNTGIVYVQYGGMMSTITLMEIKV